MRGAGTPSFRCWQSRMSVPYIARWSRNAGLQQRVQAVSHHMTPARVNSELKKAAAYIYIYICIIYCTCLVETAAVRGAWVVRGLQSILKRFPTAPQSTPRRSAAPYGAYGACGASFFFSFIAHTTGKVHRELEMTGVHNS